MAWIDVQRQGEQQIHRITEEAYELIYKEQGYTVVNEPKNSVSTAQNVSVDKSTEPTQETPPKGQYTLSTKHYAKRTSNESK